MFRTILQQFTQLFTTRHQTNLEQYINAHRPTCNADVEQLERQYTRYVARGLA